MKTNKDFITHTQSPVEELRHVPERGKDVASILLQGTRARNPEIGVPAETTSFSARVFKACPGRAPAALPGTGNGTVSPEQPGQSPRFQLVVG